MHKHNYSLELLVNGRPVQEYYKDAKAFVEARPGTEYTLRFRNNSWKRVMAVFSVDGIEVLKGKAASQADNGYIVDAFANIEIKGYRIDETTVAAFCFGSHGSSYAVTVGAEKVDKKTGKTTYDKSSRNNGVIGVRVFEEDVADKIYNQPWGSINPVVLTGGSYTLTSQPGVLFSGCMITTGGFCASTLNNTTRSFKSGGRARGTSASNNDLLRGVATKGIMGNETVYSCYSAAPVSAQAVTTDWHEIPVAAPTPDFDVGTAWGAKVEDRVKEVSFKKVSTSVDLEIYYASRQSLESYGIDFSNTKQIFAWPSAFEDKKKYCKIPPGYVGERPLKVWQQERK